MCWRWHSGTTDTVIDFGAGNSLTLSGVAPGSLTAADFIFPVDLAPTAVMLTNTVAAIAESTSTASPIKVADITFTDDGLGSNTFGLSGPTRHTSRSSAASCSLRPARRSITRASRATRVAVTVDDPTVGATPDATSATYTLNISNFPGVTILGTSGADIIDATTTAPGQPLPTGEEDIIQGLGGRRYFAMGLAGNDSLDGGDGRDTAVYTDATGGIAVDLASGSVTGAGVRHRTRFAASSRSAAATLPTRWWRPDSARAARTRRARSPLDYLPMPCSRAWAAMTRSRGDGATLISYQSATGGVTVTFTSAGTGIATGDASVGNDTFSGGQRGARICVRRHAVGQQR